MGGGGDGDSADRPPSCVFLNPEKRFSLFIVYLVSVSGKAPESSSSQRLMTTGGRGGVLHRTQTGIVTVRLLAVGVGDGSEKLLLVMLLTNH